MSRFGYGYRGSRQMTEDWNASLRRENQKMKDELRLEADFNSFLKRYDLECLIVFDRFKWEVKIFREWMNESWSVVKCHEDKSSAMNMALIEAKERIPKLQSEQRKENSPQRSIFSHIRHCIRESLIMNREIFNITSSLKLLHRNYHFFELKYMNKIHYPRASFFHNSQF